MLNYLIFLLFIFAINTNRAQITQNLFKKHYKVDNIKNFQFSEFLKIEDQEIIDKKDVFQLSESQQFWTNEEINQMIQERDMEFKHYCIHDNLVNLEEKQAILEKDIRDEIEQLPKEEHLETQDWLPIRLHVNYDNLKGKGIPQKDIDFIKNKLIPAAKAYFESTFKVHRLAKPIKPSTYYTSRRGKCGETIFPKSLYSGVANTDMILLVNGQYASNENYLAYASKCYQGEHELKSKRPTLGRIMINCYYLEKSMNTKRWFTWVETVVHEMMHAMGFSPSQFKNFRNNGGKTATNSSGQIFFQGPNTVKYGQQYFNCQSINGVPLENNGSSGSAGSHWERIALGNEGMTASDFGDAVFSKFTLNLFKDSGWYQFNDEYAQELVWEKGAGCYTMAGKCDKTTGVHKCNPGQLACNFDYTAPGKCLQKSDQFEPGCPILKGYSNTVCTTSKDFASQYKRLGGNVANNSRCWNILKQNKYTNKIHDGCYESYCKNGTLKVKIHNTWKTCGREGTTVTNNGITLKCPNREDFCVVESNCPNSCTSCGTCLNGECMCYKGFSGDSCQYYSNSNSNEQQQNPQYYDKTRGDYLGVKESTGAYFCCNINEDKCCGIYQTPYKGNCYCIQGYKFDYDKYQCVKR